MGGTVSVESEGIGHGTTFIIKMRAKCMVLSKEITNSGLNNLGKKISHKNGE